MITPSYSATATERVLPRMALDFTTGALDSRVSITRALNTATRINSSGFVEIVNANLPRFDYDPVTLAPKGLLIEESRTNLLTYSEQFNDVIWTKSQTGITVNATASPDGTSTADAAIPNTVLAVNHFVRQNITSYTSGVTYTYTVYAKAFGYTGLQMVLPAAAFTGPPFANFDLANGVASVTFPYGGSGATATITNVGNGWYRCSVTATANATAATGTQLRIMNTYTTTDSTFTPNGVDGIFLWGAQLEAGAFPTSYIPTAGTSLTRNADVVSMTGTNFSSWYNATSGAILARSRQSVITGTRPSIYISDGTANNIISLRGLVANPELYIRATTDQVQIDAGTLTANSSFGLVGAWATNNCAAAINGGAAVTDTSATIPTVDRMLIGSDGTNYLNGQIERISYWPQRITNAEAQAFSK